MFSQELQNAAVAQGWRVNPQTGAVTGVCDGVAFRALAEDGYDGYVVMETHYRKKGTLSEELLKRPGGAAFSADGYEPTAECLENLRELLTKQDSAGALEWRLV